MEDEELKKVTRQGTEFLDKLKDTVHDQYEEIERLQEKINYKETLVQGLDNTIEAYEKTIVEQEDKIERLNNIIKVKDEGFKASTEDLCETTEELEKANNIINKMNDYLVMNIANGSLDFMYRQGFKDCYEKLIELKGSDK